MNIKSNQSNFLKIIQERGYFHQATHENELEKLMNEKKITAYIGFDCTAKSLHIGSLIQIMILRYLQKCGHEPIVLLGGGTTRIGDPSGKDEARQILNDKIIAENVAGIRKTIEKFDLTNDPQHKNLKPFRFMNNDDWLHDLKYIEFLRDFGRHFSVNRMLTFESVKLRLDRQQSLSFLEFNYMILQAYDFYKLNKDYNCNLQIGGSDQWGNIVNGVELTRKYSSITFAEGMVKAFKELQNKYPTEIGCKMLLDASIRFFDLVKQENKINSKEVLDKETEEAIKLIFNSENNKLMEELQLIIHEHKLGQDNIFNSTSVFGLTTPLLTTADGKKMGKTANGAVWLVSDMLNPFEYFQYFRNVDDKDVSRFLKLFTELNLEEIAKIEQQNINEQKKILAFEATKICHGEENAKFCQEKAEKIFSNKADNIDDLPQINLNLTKEELENGKNLATILKEEDLCSSIGEARRLIKGGGVKINDEKIDDEFYSLKFNNENSYFRLSLGKKKFFKINIK